MDKMIIEQRKYSENTKDDFLTIVLAKLPDNEITPFVTWIYNSQTGGYSAGHYFKNIEEAVTDYKTR